MKTTLVVLIWCFPFFLLAQEVGDTVLQLRTKSTCAATTYKSISPDTLPPQLAPYGFSANGIVLRKKLREDFWKNIPSECRIRWGRKRDNFLGELISDIDLFFNTFDTTYVERNRYDGMFVLNNVNFLQHIYLEGNDPNGGRQILHFEPAHTSKVGPKLGWGALALGYTFGVVPDRYGGSTSEFNIATYNSKFGFDLNYTRSKGNYNLISAEGFEGIQKKEVAGTRVQTMTSNLLALNLYYVFNYRHFSYPAALSMTNVQLKSAGTWIAGLRYDHQRITFNDKKMEIVLQTFHPSANLNDALRFSSLDYRQVGFSFGYAYNWVPQRGWLVSATVAPSFGYRYNEGERFTPEQLWNKMRKSYADFIFRVGAVWTTGRYYVGLSSVSYLYHYRLENFSLSNSVHYIRFYVGLYFHRKKHFRGEKNSGKW